MTNYRDSSLALKLVSVGGMLVAAHCVEWCGLLRIFASSVDAAEVRSLRSYMWSSHEALRIAELHDRQSAWMSLLSDAYLFYGIAALLLLVAAWKIVGARASCLTAAALLVFTFAFDGPLLAGRVLIEDASKGHFMEAVDRGGLVYTGTYLSPMTPLAGGLIKTPLHDRRTGSMTFPLLAHRLVAGLALANLLGLVGWACMRRKDFDAVLSTNV
jgi:hypothetical protein